jgi:hypothetical protein
MLQMKRWWAAFAALAVGASVSATLLFFANPSRGTTEVYAAARDLPAGASLPADALSLERVGVASGQALLFGRADEPELTSMRAAHDLVAGQLIQRTDVMDATSITDSRLVFLPIKDAPPAGAGARVDLLALGGTADHPSVLPFALGVEVRSSVSGGLIVEVTSRQAAAFVYAANAMHLVAVIAEPGSADGAENAISSPDQAIAAAQP